MCLCPSEFRVEERASSFALKRKIADFTLTRRINFRVKSAILLPSGVYSFYL